LSLAKDDASGTFERKSQTEGSELPHINGGPNNQQRRSSANGGETGGNAVIAPARTIHGRT